MDEEVRMEGHTPSALPWTEVKFLCVLFPFFSQVKGEIKIGTSSV